MIWSLGLLQGGSGSVSDMVIVMVVEILCGQCLLVGYYGEGG